jgi:hypothetical protein
VCCPSSLATRLVLAAFVMTCAHVGQAQIPRTAAPPARVPFAPQAGVTRTNAPSPTVRLVLWTNGTETILNGLTAATGPGGAPLPTAEEVRARAQLREKGRLPGILMIQVHAGSPADETLSRLSACTRPACVIQIDQLGPNGQVVGSHSFSGGAATKQVSTNELEEFQMTFTHIVFTNAIGDTTATDDWLAN